MTGTSILLGALVGALAAWVALRLLHPIALLWHELGHALPALAASRARVDIALGEGMGRRLTCARLSIASTMFPTSGYTRYDGEGMARRARIGVVLGGPLASALGALLGFWLAVAGPGLVLRALGLVLAWSHLRILLYTFVPAGGGEAGTSEIDGARGRGSDWRDLRALRCAESSSERASAA